MNCLTTQAYNYAKECHGTQTRKFNGEPYFNHPVRVAGTVQAYDGTEAMIQAALLHDTLEDTDATYEDIERRFGKEVADLVLDVTSDKEESGRIGKTSYLSNKMRAMNDDALLIKLADRLDNVSDISNENTVWRAAYVLQTIEILKALDGRAMTCAHVSLLEKIREKLMTE